MLDTQEQFAEAMGSIGAMPPMSYWNKRSGWGWSTGAMKELAKACGEAGVHFEQGLVNGLIIEDGDVRGARTNDGRVHLASKLVILAAGSWSPAVFPEISEKLTATGQVLAKIQLTSEEAARYAKTVSRLPASTLLKVDIGLLLQPVFLDMQTGFYVFPPTENNVVKLAIHQHGWTNEQPSLSDEHSKVSLPRTRHFGGDPSENIPREAVKDLREQLSRVYPELAAKPFSDTRLCW
jgi:sarcosine oxidase/L-pipecolate oxidase